MSVTGKTLYPIEGNKQYFTLQNEEYIRRLAIPYTSWNQLAIGVLCSVEATGNFTGGLHVGLGFYDGNGPGVGFKNYASSKRLLGGGLGFLVSKPYGSSYDVWTYGTTVSGSNAYASLIWYGSILSGSVTPGGNITQYYINTFDSKSMVCGVTFIKSSPNITAYALASPNFLGKIDNHIHTDSTLQSGIMTYLNWAPYIDNYSQYSTNGVQITNLDGAPLDTVHIFWTGSVPLRVYQIMVIRKG